MPKETLSAASVFSMIAPTSKSSTPMSPIICAARSARRRSRRRQSVMLARCMARRRRTLPPRWWYGRSARACVLGVVSRHTGGHTLVWRRTTPPDARRRVFEKRAPMDSRSPAWVFDPICGMWLAPEHVIATYTYIGYMYAFCSMECHDLFVRAPDVHVLRLAHDPEACIAHYCPLQRHEASASDEFIPPLSRLRRVE